jgi:hypothetical protein
LLGLVIVAKARIQKFHHVLDAGYGIPDLNRDRHDDNNSYHLTILIFPGKEKDFF